MIGTLILLKIGRLLGASKKSYLRAKEQVLYNEIYKVSRQRQACLLNKE
jgi:hypothetical protein